MILERRRYIFLRDVFLFYELNAIHDIKQSLFSRIRVRVYEKLNLPKNFICTHIKKTIRIRVHQDDEALLLSFKKNTRNEIRSAIKNPDVFVKVQDDNIAEHYKLYCKLEYEQDRKPRSISAFYDTQTVLIGAYLNGSLVSGISFKKYTPVFWTFAIYSDRLQQKSQSKLVGNASRLVVFEACKYARENGFEFLDLAYVNDSTEQKRGVSAFKRQFGGEEVIEYNYRFESFLWKIVKLILQLTRIIKV